MKFIKNEPQELYDIGKCPLCDCFPMLYTDECHSEGHVWHKAHVQCPTTGCNPFICMDLSRDKSTSENKAISKWQDWTGNKSE